ncbi:MAG: hypothetical protein KDK11_15930 [Maritimibacter sp.]|nr:hypothetical protein [Maritimibacter sp.]
MTDADFAGSIGLHEDTLRKQVKRNAAFRHYFDVTNGTHRGNATEYEITAAALGEAAVRKRGKLGNTEAVSDRAGGAECGRDPDAKAGIRPANGSETKPGDMPAMEDKGGEIVPERRVIHPGKAGLDHPPSQGNPSSNPDCADGAQEVSEKDGNGGSGSVSHRRRTNVRTEDLGSKDDRFAEILDGFISSYPRPGDRDAVEAVLRGAIREGVDPEHILAGARAYAAEQKGNAPRYIAYPENWLRQRRWEQYPAPSAPASEDAVLANLAAMVTAGKSYASSAISSTRAHQLLAAGLVTRDQLRAVGVAA